MYVENISSAPNPVSTKAPGPVKQVQPREYEADTSAKMPAAAPEASMDGSAQGVKKDTAANERGYASQPEEKKTQDNERIRKAIEKMNAQLPNSEVKFGIHDKTDRVTIKLVNKDTKEVIKEFPPEKTLDMIAKCMELAGVLMDEKL